MRQSPRGERLTLPTFGPSGIQLRLNCWVKKRRQNTVSHFFTVASSYNGPLPSTGDGSQKAFYANMKIFDGEKP